MRGLSRMVEDDRYCIDIVTQLSAVRAALRRAEEEILGDHVAHCVEHAIASGNKAEQRRKVAELIERAAAARNAERSPACAEFRNCDYQLRTVLTWIKALRPAREAYAVVHSQRRERS